MNIPYFFFLNTKILLLLTVTFFPGEYSHLNFLCRKIYFCTSFYGPDVKTRCYTTRCQWTLPFVYEVCDAQKGMSTDNGSSDNGFHIGSFSTDILNIFWLNKSKNLIVILTTYLHDRSVHTPHFLTPVIGTYTVQVTLGLFLGKPRAKRNFPFFQLSCPN